MRHKKGLAMLLALCLCGQTGMVATATESESYLKQYEDSDGIMYHDIADGKTTDRPEQAYSKTKDKEKAMAKAAVQLNGGLKNWAKVAYNVIGADQNNYYPYDDDSFADCWGKSNKHYFDMVSHLSNTSEGITFGERKKDSGHRTGLQVAYSLSDVKNALYNEPCYLRNGKIKASNLTKYSDMPLLNNTDNQLVLYNLVSTLEKYDVQNKFDYNVFGLVFYDFTFHPIDDDDAIYLPQEMINKINAGVDQEVEEYNLKGSDYDFSCVDSSNPEFDRLTNNSNKKQQISVTTTKSNTSSAESSYTHVETVKKGKVKIKTKQKDRKIFRKESHVTKTTAKLFSEAYSNAYGEKTSQSTTEEKSSTFSRDVEAYSRVTVGEKKNTLKFKVDYNQSTAISFKTAVVAIHGRFYDDNAATLDVKGYTQYQFSTVFGDVDKDNKALGDADAVSCLKDRYDTWNTDKNLNNEGTCYTIQAQQKSDNKKTLSPSVKWNTIDSMSEYPIKSLIDTMESKNHTMSVYGAKMEGSSDEYEYNSSDPLALKPLKNITPYTNSTLKKTVDSMKLVVGDEDSITNYVLKATFNDGTDYPYFDKSKGKWLLTDEDGNEVKNSKVAELKTSSGGSTRVVAKAKGDVYLTYKPDNEAYSYYDEGSKKTVSISSKDIESTSIRIRVYSSRAEANAASMFSGENPTGIVLIIVVVLIVAGAAYLVVKRRKRAQ